MDKSMNEKKFAMFCNPKTAVEFICEDDAEEMENSIVITPLLPEGEVTLVPVDEFLEWLKGKKS